MRTESFIRTRHARRPSTLNRVPKMAALPDNGGSKVYIQSSLWRENAKKWMLLGSLLLVPGTLLLSSGCSSDPPAETSPTPEMVSDALMVLAPFDGEVVVSATLNVYVELSAAFQGVALSVSVDGQAQTGFWQETQPDGRVALTLEGLAAGDHTLTLSVQKTDAQGGIQVGSVSRHVTIRPGGAQATTISHANQLIDGVASSGRMGDILIANEKVQFVVQNLSRNYLGMMDFGGNVIDADVVRVPWQSERDQVDALAAGVNVEDTLNPTEVKVIADGSDGGPAIVEARGPDDLLETINISSIATLFTSTKLTALPKIADDKDLPITLVNRFILKPGDNYVTWETELINDSDSDVAFYYGDYVNASSQVEFFSPGMGFGVFAVRRTCDWMGFLSHDPEVDYAFGYIPEIARGSSLASLQGVFFPMIGQNLLTVMLGGEGPAYDIPPKDSYTFRRYLVVGRDLGTIQDADLKIQGLKTGTVEGVVTRGGSPVRGARVAAVRTDPNGSNVISHWVTDENGHYGGLLEPGGYQLYAGIEGSANPGEDGLAPHLYAQVTEDHTLPANFDFPLPASLRVRVVDESGAPVPAKVSLVGFDPSPDPTKQDTNLSQTVLAVLSDPDWDPTPFGLVKVGFADATGDTDTIAVEPGEYQLVISRGIEYSVDSRRVELKAGELLELDSEIARVVETPGFAGGDFHVHSIDSWDAPVARNQRVAVLLAEGLDMFAATDHTIRVDYTEEVARQHGSDLLAPFIGEEITSFDIGHYNLFPASNDPSLLNMGALDWVGASPVGENFPSKGGYDLTPSQLYSAALKDPGTNVLQLNHLNNVLHGLFSLQGVDSAKTPPQSSMPLSLFRQDPNQTNLFDPQWTAVEIWRGYVDDQDFVLEENLGDMFNLFNQGIVRTMTCNSDTHSSIDTPTGGPRNLVGVGDLTGTALAASGDLMAQALNEGRVVCTNGPFVLATLTTSAGEAGLSPGLSRMVSATDGLATLHIQVQSAEWARFDEIDVFINNAPYPMQDDDDAPGMDSYQGEDLSAIDVPRYEVAPDIRLVEGVNFTLERVAPFDDLPSASRYEAEVSIPLTGLTHDSWVVVVARGTAGNSGALFPVLPGALEPDKNASLDDLTDGNVGEGGVLAMGVTNPLFLDVDGNGVYNPPGVRLSTPPADAHFQRRARPLSH